MNFALTVIGLASAIIAAAPWFAELAADPINAANFARIKPGMSRADVEKIIGRRADETTAGDVYGFRAYWQGRGRNIIIVDFRNEKDGGERSTDLRTFFNPSPWERLQEWWGGYQLQPDGGRTKRLKGAA